MQVVDVRVPDGYRIVKKIGVVVVSFYEIANAYIEKSCLNQLNIVTMT